MSSALAPNVPEALGNSVTRASSKIAYCITLNNYSNSDWEEIQEFGSKYLNIKSYVFGREVGKSGTPHIQGYFRLKTKERFETLRNKYPVFKRCHFESARGTDQQNLAYCGKDQDYVTSIKKMVPLKLINDMRPWQIELKSKLDKEPDDRSLIWIFDPATKNGKTALMKYMINKLGCPFSYGGRMSDVINLIFNNKDYFRYAEIPIMFFNFTKTIDAGHLNYSLFEAIKDGCISNNKFETGCFLMNPPHVVILCNQLPNTKKMGANRFEIYTIINHELVEYDLGKPK